MKVHSGVFRLAGLFLLACGGAFAGSVDYFTDNGYANAVSVLQHPCAEYYEGTTYIAYQGPHEDPYVCAFNHETKNWSGPIRAGVNTMGRTPDQLDPRMVDNHGRPALIVDGKGYIHLIFGGHGGDFRYGPNTLGTTGKGKQTHVVSKKPRDISEWEVLDNITPSGTYSQFVKLANGDIYLFYRHGSHRSDWVYQKSTDDCRTFAPPVSILKHKAQESDPNIHDAWYAWFENGKGNTITASYVYHPCMIQGHTKDRFNCYYMLMNCADGSWTNAAGATLAFPVTKEYADTNTLILNTGDERSNHGSCRVDSEGNPHLYFRQGPMEIRYYRWLGDAWQKPIAVAGGSRGQDGDFVVESPLKARMVVRQAVAGEGEVCWWETADGGLSWAKGPCLISGGGRSYDVSSFVRNAIPDARLVVAEIVEGQDHLFRRLYLLGDHGPVGRLEEEAANVGERLKSLLENPPARATPKPGKLKLGKQKKQKSNTGGDDDDE